MTRDLLVLLVGATLLSGCEQKRSSVLEGFDPGPTPPDLVEGEELFNRSCAACHGVKAIGSASGPPLVHILYEPSHHADEAFRRAVAQGVVPHHWSFGRMPPVPNVSTQDVEAIISYVRWLQRQGGIS